MARLFCTGDCHGQIDIDKLCHQFPIQEELTKEDILIVLGDWGAIWSGDCRDGKMLNWWKNRNWTTFVILGNHCNYSAIKKLPTVEKFCGPVWNPCESVFIAQTGNIYNLNGKICLAINGADSQDKELRKEGVSWWPEEQITEEDIQKAKFNLKRYNNKVDYLLTHTGGVNVCASLGFKPTVSDVRLSQILNTFQYNYHYLGHYHVDRIIDNKTRIFYNDIKEIY